MINIFTIFFKYLIILLPVSLITGPAIPDIIITLTGIFFIFLVLTKNLNINIDDNYLIKISFIFWIYLLIISFFAINQIISFTESIIFFRILLIPVFLFFWLSNDSKFLEKILLSLFICIIFVILDTLYQFTQYNPEYGFGKDFFGFKSNWYGRLTGPFGNELIPGAYLTRFSFLGLIFLFIKLHNKKYMRYLGILYLSAIGLTIFATGERMALATFLMGLIFLLIFYNGKRMIFFISLIIIPSLIFITQKMHPIYNDFVILESTPQHLGLKIKKSYKCGDSLTNQCSKIINVQPNFLSIIKDFGSSPYGEIYLTSLSMFKDNKILGIGLNNFTFLCKNNSKYKNLIKNYECASHPHNIHMQWLTEAGIIGFIIFSIYLFYISYLIIIRNFNNYSIIGLTPLLIMFWPIMSTGSLLKNWNGVSTFFIIGICLSLSKIKIKN